MNDSPPKKRREPWFYIYWGTALMMLTAIGMFAWLMLIGRREGSRVPASESPRTGGGRPADAYQVLSRFNPPAYRDLGDAPDPPATGYRAAIARYTQRDYQGAIAGLGAATANSKSPQAHFYLGICYLYTDDTPSGIAELRKTLDSINTPYAAQAHFYLAKGLLRTGDIAGARQHLDSAIALHGDLEQQAENLLSRLK